MKKLFLLFTILILLAGNVLAYDIKANFVAGTIYTNLLSDAETTGNTFTVLMGAYSNDIPNGASRVTVYTSDCTTITGCSAREIVTISASVCAGTTPTRVCTLTITGRNQESTTHSGDWVQGSRVIHGLTIAQMTQYETDLALKANLVSPTFTTPNIGSATGSITGNAGTATALAANGANCSAGQAPLGVDASGAVETCWTPASSTAPVPATTCTNQFISAIATSGAGTCTTETDPKVGALTAGRWCLTNDGTTITCTSTPPAGTGDVEAVGDCASGLCLDGTSDGGTWIKFYDADGVGQLINGNLTAARVWTLPNETGTICSTGSVCTGYQALLTNPVTGTGTQYYWPYWSSSSALGSVNIGATKVVCSNASGIPVACTNLTDTVGTGDVSSVGDCADGACLDGSADGGTYIRVYDGDSNYGQVQTPNLSGNVVYTMPSATSTIYGTGTGTISSANLAGSLSDESGTGVVAFTTSPVFTTPNIGSATGSVSGNAGTASALAADPVNCGAGEIALGITAAGVAECTATPSGLTSVGATTFTGALTGTASGNLIAASPQLTGTPAILNGGSLVIKAAGDATSVTLGPTVGTILGVTGTINATGLQIGGVPVLTTSKYYTLCSSGCSYAIAQDGITDDTVAIQSAFDDTPTSAILQIIDSGSNIIMGAVDVSESKTILGPATIKLTGASAGFIIDTNAVDLTVKHLTMFGDGLTASIQYAITTSGSGVTPGEVLVDDVEIYNTTQAIAPSKATKLTVINSNIHDIVGSASGQGYCIISGASGMVVIDNNTLDDCGRHAIYTRGASNITIKGNNIIDFAQTSGGTTEAIALAGTKSATVIGNVFTNYNSTAINITPNDADEVAGYSKGTNIIGNYFETSDNDGRPLKIGPVTPVVGTTQYVQDILFMGNIIIPPANRTNGQIVINSGSRIGIKGNYFSTVSSTGASNYAIYLVGSNDTYYDDIEVSDNSGVWKNASGYAQFLTIGSALCTGSTNINIYNNTLTLNRYADKIYYITAPTNANIKTDWDYRKPVTLASGSQTISIAGYNNFIITGNASGSVVTDFLYGYDGKNIQMVFSDANTTIDLSGTNLTGNKGADWYSLASSWLKGFFTTTYWYLTFGDITFRGSQSITAGTIITANSCGGIKEISAASAVTTDTTNTFTDPAQSKGCCMDVVNTGNESITLDANSNFVSDGGANVELTASKNCIVRVCNNGTKWYQLAPKLCQP